MAEVSDPRLGKLLDGRYRLDQRLGAGGMGVVYKGEQVALGKPVAVKLLHDALASIPDLFKRLQREAQAMSKLAHPNLVSVIDSGVSDGVPFLVMDFVSGRTLSDVLADGRVPAARAVGIARQILAGVSHAHASGVVHRDLKPDNILLLADVEGDFVKILDFGLAKLVHQSEGTQLTNTGFALGTPGYMSPEQARGTPSDERSDVYSVGVILYHLVTGRKPFVADSPLAVLRMHMDDTPVPPTKVVPKACSHELERAILRAMAKEPKARFQSVADFARALVATPEASGTEPSLGHDATVAARRRPRGGLGLFGLLVRVVVAGIVVAGFTIGWLQLSRRQQAKVKRRLDDAVKVAEGAFESVRKTAQPSGQGVKPSPPVETQRPSPPVEAKRPPPPPVEAKRPPPPPVESKRPPSLPAETAKAPAPVAAPPRADAPVAAPAPANPTPVVTAPAVAAPAAASPADEDDDDEATEEVPLPPSDTPGAKLEEQARAVAPPGPPTATPPAPADPARAPVPSTPPRARGPTTHDAAKLLAAGRVDEAVQTLYAVRRHAPHDSWAALLLGHAYFKKLWRTDGLREYDHAIKLNESLRHDGLLIRNTVGALEDPTYRLARAIIKARIGTAARAQLKHEARVAKSPRVRQRAARLAQQLGTSHRR